MFRKAALQARRRTEGQVILVQSPRAWMFTLLAASVVVIAALVLFYGEFGRSQNLRGVLVPSAGLIKLYPDTPLTVLEVLCEEGDLVEEGTPLLRLANHRVESSGDEAHTTRLFLLDQRLMLEHRKIAATTRAFEARQQQLRKRIDGAKNQLHEITLQSLQQRRVAESASQQFSRLDSLLTNKLLSEMEYEERRRNKLASEAAFQAARQSQAQIEAEIQTLLAERETIQAQFAIDSLQMQSELLSMEAQRVGLSEQIEIRIVAPRSGTVQGIHTNPGQRVTPQQALVTLFPARAVLEAELYVPGSALAAVRVAQRIKLKYDAFPFDRFGGYLATVSHISYTIVRPDELQTSLALRESVYRVTATLADVTLDHQAGEFALQPGMTFSTSVISERKRLIDWLIQPFKRVADVYWRRAPSPTPSAAQVSTAPAAHR